MSFKEINSISIYSQVINYSVSQLSAHHNAVSDVHRIPYLPLIGVLGYCFLTDVWTRHHVWLAKCNLILIMKLHTLLAYSFKSLVPWPGLRADGVGVCCLWLHTPKCRLCVFSWSDCGGNNSSLCFPAGQFETIQLVNCRAYGEHHAGQL